MSLISNKTGMQPNPILKEYPLYTTTTEKALSEKDAKQQTPAAEMPESGMPESGTAVAGVPETSLRKEAGTPPMESPSKEESGQGTFTPSTTKTEMNPLASSAEAHSEASRGSETKFSETNPEWKTSVKVVNTAPITPTKEVTTLPENPEKESEETRSTETKSTGTTDTETSTAPETGTTPQGRERSPSRTSEESESSRNTSESKDPNTSSQTNISTGNVPGTTAEYHSLAKEKKLELENILLRDSLVSLKEECNVLVREQTEKVETLRGEISECTSKLEAEMKELRQGLAAAIHTYSECLSLKTNGIHSTIEESLDRLEMNNRWIREGTDRLIEEDRAVIFGIPALVEEEMTRAANETSDYVEGALKETVGKYTNEIKSSTKFLRKQVEERKKASRFEKVTDVLMRVFCPILALGTFVLTCAVACLV